MINFIKQLNDKVIAKKVNESLKAENKDYVEYAINYIEEEIKYVDSIIGNEVSNLKQAISNFSRLTTLDYVFNDNNLFFTNNRKDDLFIVECKDGEVIYPKKSGTNGVYLHIVNKYKNELENISKSYYKLKPFLKHYSKLNNYKKIISGKSLYDLYNYEIAYNKEAKVEFKEIKSGIEKVKESICAKTGWYELGNNVLGYVDAKDLDNKIKNAIVLKDKWMPYSQDEKNKIIEEDFISENADMLNQYKSYYKALNKIKDNQDKITNNINKQINDRNELIEKIKQKKNLESRKQI